MRGEACVPLQGRCTDQRALTIVHREKPLGEGISGTLEQRSR